MKGEICLAKEFLDKYVDLEKYSLSDSEKKHVRDMLYKYDTLLV